jgi:hypothetical protein
MADLAAPSLQLASSLMTESALLAHATAVPKQIARSGQ